LHETAGDFCSPNGLLILELVEDDVQNKELADKLQQIEGVEVKEMIFAHP